MREPCILTLERDGYYVIAPFLNEREVQALRDSLEHIQPDAVVKEKNGSVYGVRNVLQQVPNLRGFVHSDKMRKLVLELLGNSARMVRAIYFDKTKFANWKVWWHQDRTIAVRGRTQAAGFNGWTVKSGIPHVQPPEEFMQRMVTLRIHLDACNEDNGALRVIPSSHQRKLTDSEAVRLAQNSASVICHVPAGGVMAMKPLLVHASSVGSTPSHRRVLHLEFSPDGLPDGLEWYEAA